MGLRDLEQAELAELFAGLAFRRQLQVVAADEHAVDTERREDAGRVDPEVFVGHPLELLEQRAVLVGVDDAEAVPEIRRQPPRIAGVDRVPYLDAGEIPGRVAVAVAGQDAVRVVVGVELPSEHQLAGGVDLVGLLRLHLGTTERGQEQSCQHRDDRDHDEQLQ